MRWGQPINLHFKRVIRLREHSRSKIRGQLPENKWGMAMSSLGQRGISPPPHGGCEAGLQGEGPAAWLWRVEPG